jgi:hypothetical protein
MLVLAVDRVLVLAVVDVPAMAPAAAMMMRARRMPPSTHRGLGVTWLSSSRRDGCRRPSDRRKDARGDKTSDDQ